MIARGEAAEEKAEKRKVVVAQEDEDPEKMLEDPRSTDDEMTGT